MCHQHWFSVFVAFVILMFCWLCVWSSALKALRGRWRPPPAGQGGEGRQQGLQAAIWVSRLNLNLQIGTGASKLQSRPQGRILRLQVGDQPEQRIGGRAVACEFAAPTPKGEQGVKRTLFSSSSRLDLGGPAPAADPCPKFIEGVLQNSLRKTTPNFLQQCAQIKPRQMPKFNWNEYNLSQNPWKHWSQGLVKNHFQKICFQALPGTLPKKQNQCRLCAISKLA